MELFIASASFSHCGVVGPWGRWKVKPIFLPFRKEGKLDLSIQLELGFLRLDALPDANVRKGKYPEKLHENFTTLYERSRGGSFRCHMKFVHGTSNIFGPDPNRPSK